MEDVIERGYTTCFTAATRACCSSWRPRQRRVLVPLGTPRRSCIVSASDDAKTDAAGISPGEVGVGDAVR